MNNDISFLLAKRNVQKNRKTTLVVIFTLSLIFAIFTVMFGIKSIYMDIFTKEAQSSYPNIDIVINYDEYSSSRLINERYLSEDYEDIEYVLAFFNLQVLTEFNGEKFYGNMFSSQEHEFEIFLDLDVDINDKETVISSSFAKEKNLQIKDKFSIYILEEIYEYEVKDIIEDEGVFKDISFYVDKNAIIEKIYGVSFLENFGNNIYINSSNISSVYDQLKIDERYNDYGISLVVDEDRVEALVDDYISIISLAGMIVLVSLVIVLYSLFEIVLRDIYLDIKVLNTLGDDKLRGYKICAWQWIMYAFISFVIGMIIAHIVINLGAYIYGVRELIVINPLIVISSLIIIVSLIVVFNLVLVRRFYLKESKKIEENILNFFSKYQYIFIALLGVFLLYVIVSMPFSVELNSLFIVSISFYLALKLLIVLIKVFVLAFSKKRTSFSLFNAKHLRKNKFIHQSLLVVFVALMVVGIMLTVRIFFSNQVDTIKDMYKFDAILTNIHDYQDNLIDDIEALDVESVNPGLVYENLLVSIDDDKPFIVKMMISVERDDFGDYLGFDISDLDESYFNHNLPFIMFPISYHYVYDLNKGDIVSVDLSSKLGNVDFVVGGFINTNFDQFVYSNLYDKMNDLDLSYNTILINSDNSQILFDLLISEYGNRMYYLIDSQAELEKLIDMENQLLALFTVITVFVILSFMLVVFNNTTLKFYSLKNDYAKVGVLGIDRRTVLLNLGKELLYLCVLLGIVGTIEMLVFSKYLKYVLLFFDYYKNIRFDLFGYIVTIFSVLFTLFLSYIYYFYKIKQIDLANEIRVL
ncbi:MAG: hypothetical protein WC154_06900 [Candidatus Izemoplasmatales bacterium]